MTSTALAIAKPSARSRVTNGKDALPGVDGRSEGARRFRDIVAALTAELGAVGVADQLQVRAAASLQMQTEMLTAAMTLGEVVDHEQLSRAANGAIRAVDALKRRKAPTKRKRGGGDLQSYLAAKAASA